MSKHPHPQDHPHDHPQDHPQPAAGRGLRLAVVETPPSAGLLRDPVCGMTVKSDSPYQAQHAGQRLRFCSQHCLDRFGAEPHKYLSARHADHAPAAAPDAGARVNINAAGVDELVRLPGIGPKLAQAIVEYRSDSPFQRAEDLRNVKGVGDKLFEKLKDRITVGEAGASSPGRGS